jgi:hypothetical protein
MGKVESAVLLVSMCLLLVVTLGAVESGRIVGANYTGSLPIPGLGRLLNWRIVNYTSTTSTMAINSSAASESTTNEVSRSAGNYFNQSVLFSFNLPVFSSMPPSFTWFLVILMAGCFVGACFLVLRVKTGMHVVNLAKTLDEMELQQEYLTEAWSPRMRNAALLRYYLLMRKACSKVGILEQKTETPQEYIGRASSELEVEREEAVRFAAAVNKSRYGEELSKDEARRTSAFMGTFIEAIRKKANEVQS